MEEFEAELKPEGVVELQQAEQVGEGEFSQEVLLVVLGEHLGIEGEHGGVELFDVGDRSLGGVSVIVLSLFVPRR